MTIAEFLEARIVEDEDLARKADSGRWLPEDKGVTFEFYGEEFPEGEAQARMVADTRANQNHIAQWDPTRVLAECAAKRAILGLHGPVKDDGWLSGSAHDYLWCGSCGSIDDSPEPHPCDTLKALAAIYADHPDYQQEWALNG